MHQLRFLAEQTPLDGTTYALASMLFSRVVAVGGVGADSAQSEEAQEQLTLVVSIVGACCGECTSCCYQQAASRLLMVSVQDDAYPRLQTIKDLLQIIAAYSKLSKEAASALTDLSAAIKDVASQAEFQQLILGTLSAESNVRGSALQALQVSRTLSVLRDTDDAACRSDGFGLFGRVVDRYA
jgi:hypothetical protein